MRMRPLSNSVEILEWSRRPASLKRAGGPTGTVICKDGSSRPFDLK